MIKTIVVVGTGKLADRVRKELSGSDECAVASLPDLTEGVPEAARLVILAFDEEPPYEYGETEERLWGGGVPWLRCFAGPDESIAGPLVRPGAPGCSVCSDLRRRLAGNPPGDGWTAAAEEASRERSLCDYGIGHTAKLIAAESRRVLQGRESRLQGRVCFIRLSTLESTLHVYEPDPLCPVCGRLPDDSPETARLTLQPRPKAEAGGYRYRRPAEVKAALSRGGFLSARTGMMNRIWHDPAASFAAASASLLSFASGSEVTAGRSHSYAQSDLTAMLEGLERYCGQEPRGKKTVCSGSYRSLAEQALDPVQAGLYDRKQYELPDFPFEPFDPDAELDWVWGYSFMRQRPILVPLYLAYYSGYLGGGFAMEGSNGCALGGSLEEAILHGLFEVAERDAFLIAWYARLPLPRLDPESADDPELSLMLDRLRATDGCEVQLFNMTMENGIPAIWAIARSLRPGTLNLLCAAGAHLDPLRAAKSAVHELAGMLPFVRRMFEENREETERLYEEPERVERMEDHVLLYGLPQAEKRLRFLLRPVRPARTFGDAFGGKIASSSADLTDDLRDVLERFHRQKLDVIVIDQTSPELARCGLHCVKVLVPGMLPMTFGHRMTRLAGLGRVYHVPVRLGYRKRPLRRSELNPFPHPFA